jgi:mono/diheme cytochrome c family protein
VLLDITARGTAAVVGGGYESDMPGFGDTYSEQQLRDILAWIKSQWPERARAFQADVTKRDQASQ